MTREPDMLKDEEYEDCYAAADRAASRPCRICPRCQQYLDDVGTCRVCQYPAPAPSKEK